jgi:hypothetical protein
VTIGAGASDEAARVVVFGPLLAGRSVGPVSRRSAR